MPWRVLDYREFYDVPRAILAANDEAVFLFHSPFDEARDEYVDRYDVYRLPESVVSALKGSWVGLEEHAIEKLPSIPVDALPFKFERRTQ